MWNPKWRREGRDPDYRFSLANERTFLAWMRTAMALLAGAVVLEQFADRLGPHRVVLALSGTLAVLAAAMCVNAYRHWRDSEIAMRHGRPLPAPMTLPLLAGATLLAAAAITALLLWPGP